MSNADVAIARALTLGPDAMEGDLRVAPGATLFVGYEFMMPGKHPAGSLTYVEPQAVFAWTCVSGPGAGSFTVSMPNGSYSVPANSSAWFPSGDHRSPLVSQGSFEIPIVPN